MTNLEWIRTLPAEPLAEMIEYCDVCVYDKSKLECVSKSCYGGIIKWLNMERSEEND